MLKHNLQALLNLWISVATVARRRLRSGPLRPSWSFLFEVYALLMKRQFALLSRLSYPEQRQAWRDVALPNPVALRTRSRRESLGGVRCGVVVPRSGQASRTLLYLHGGAYHFGSLGEYQELCGRLALACEARVIAPDYRLAPEHPFPAPVEDALRVYRELVQTTDPRRLAIVGDSAGGGLTAATLLSAREAGLPLPACAALLCPWVDLTAQGGSLEANEPYDFFSPGLVASWAGSYAGAERGAPLASPALAELRGLPPLLVQVGGAEMILDQVRAFAARARAAGVDCTLEEWPDMFHDWHLFAALFAPSARAVARVGEFIRART